MNRTDVRGYSCPEPVLMTKKALMLSSDGIEVIADNNTSTGNITRFASNQGYKVTCKMDGEDYILTITK